jgi:N-acetylmuramoyl-L-alanine amidase
VTNPVIAIDVGHNCPPDTGASATVEGKTLTEDSIVLAVGRELQQIATSNGIETVWCLPITAISVTDSLRQRVRISNDAGATIYIALHCNVFNPTDQPMGTEVFAGSSSGRILAQKIADNLAKLGWKNRGVKDGSGLYVIKNTDAVAVLVEICFLDSSVDRSILKKYSYRDIAMSIFNSIGVVNPNPATDKLTTVLEAILANPGSTSGVDGLDDQIVQRMGLQSLVKVSAPNFITGENCIPYFQPHVSASLKKILASNPKLKMTCNSAYRSCVRQCVLYECYQRGIGRITLAAKPGENAPHSQAIAVDIEEWTDWKPIFQSDDWHWQGSSDPMHFDLYSQIPDLPSRSIKVFQELYNENNSKKISVDGVWGQETRYAMLRSPSGGWK